MGCWMLAILNTPPISIISILHPANAAASASSDALTFAIAFSKNPFRTRSKNNDIVIVATCICRRWDWRVPQVDEMIPKSNSPLVYLGDPPVADPWKKIFEVGDSGGVIYLIS